MKTEKQIREEVKKLWSECSHLSEQRAAADAPDSDLETWEAMAIERRFWKARAQLDALEWALDKPEGV